MITWYVSFFFLVENSVVFNYTCRTSILSILFYCSKFTDSWWYCFKIFFAKKNKFNSISYIYIPINSAKPPTGSRQVPVTNCNRRIFFSLSISLTNWSKNTAFSYIKISSTFEFFFFFYLSFVDVRMRDAKTTIEQNFAVKKNPTRIKSIIKKGTCISLLMLKLTFQNHMTCLEFLW